MSDIRTPRRRPIIAKDWQLDVLKKLHAESENPTDDQRLAVVAETGLDEKWVRNWFTRQRSRNKKGQMSTSDSSIVPTFRVQLRYPPTPNRPEKPRRQTSPATSPQPSLTAIAEATPPSNDPPTCTTSKHTTTMPTYSRDPLCDRYPDFSQFFRPRETQQPRAFEWPASFDASHTSFMQLLSNPSTDSQPSLCFQGLSGFLNPLQLGDLSMDSTSSMCLQPYPVAFSTRLVDLTGRR